MANGMAGKVMFFSASDPRIRGSYNGPGGETSSSLAIKTHWSLEFGFIGSLTSISDIQSAFYHFNEEDGIRLMPREGGFNWWMYLY